MDHYPENIPALQKTAEKNCARGGAMGKKPSKCFPAIQALCLILTNFLHKILPPENSHAKSEKTNMLQKIAQLPTPTKSNDPSLSESVYVAYCPSLCAIGNQLLGL